MHFRSILSTTLAVMLSSAFAVEARDAGTPSRITDAGYQVPMPAGQLPGVFGNRASTGETIQLAQATTDPRVVQLEEQIRTLNGTLEELNFQVLQLQEQIRKMQEDNEFRFQELEKKSDAGGKANRSVAENPAKPADAAPAKPNRTAAAAAPSVEDIIVDDQTAAAPSEDSGLGAPPRTFGRIRFDANGNVIGGDANGAPVQKQGSIVEAQPPKDNTQVAALPSSSDPEELYRNAYQFILSGDYSTAEAGFRDHIAKYPKDAKAPDAHFWLGESLLGQKKYRDAAETFLAANKDYPKSKKAPDMLLKLGISLVGLKQRDVACATFSEVNKRYPQATAALKERVKQEQALASC